MGKYIYCITKKTNTETVPGARISGTPFGQIGLGENPTEVSELSYKDLSAVISESSIKTYELSRKNLIGHQKVCEEAMKRGAILPVKFDTVAESSEQILRKVLEAQYKELAELLEEFSGRVELGLKVLWSNMEKIFSSLLKENPALQKRKEELAQKDPQKTYFERADFGHEVQDALKKKKRRLAKEILFSLQKMAVEAGELPLHGDKMILNRAFLVSEKNQKDFDLEISKLVDQFKELQFKYVGPLPPYDFIEVIIDLERGKIKRSKREEPKEEHPSFVPLIKSAQGE